MSWILALAALLSAPHQGASAAAKSETCALPPADQAWLDRSIRAWNYAAANISGIGHVKSIEAVIFDDYCMVTSATAMNGGPSRWSGSLHHGKIVLPDGGSLPPQVTSFAGSKGDKNFFVMSTTSPGSSSRTGRYQ